MENEELQQKLLKILEERPVTYKELQAILDLTFSQVEALIVKMSLRYPIYEEGENYNIKLGLLK